MNLRDSGVRKTFPFKDQGGARDWLRLPVVASPIWNVEEVEGY